MNFVCNIYTVKTQLWYKFELSIFIKCVKNVRNKADLDSGIKARITKNFRLRFSNTL